VAITKRWLLILVVNWVGLPGVFGFLWFNKGLGQELVFQKRKGEFRKGYLTLFSERFEEISARA